MLSYRILRRERRCAISEVVFRARIHVAAPGKGPNWEAPHRFVLFWCTSCRSLRILYYTHMSLIDPQWNGYLAASTSFSRKNWVHKCIFVLLLWTTHIMDAFLGETEAFIITRHAMQTIPFLKPHRGGPYSCYMLLIFDHSFPFPIGKEILVTDCHRRWLSFELKMATFGSKIGPEINFWI